MKLTDSLGKDVGMLWLTALLKCILEIVNFWPVVSLFQYFLLIIMESLLLSIYWFAIPLKAVDTNGICQRLAFTVGVSQHKHKITNLWKFELNGSSNLRDNNERKKRPCHAKLCAFRWLISRPQVLNLRSWSQIRGKLRISLKLCYFKGSRFSQCFLLSTSPHYSSPSKALCQ